ncbi:hypothetical protein Bbelb_276800 [Branchiostoma belcheri]|nr:hypothetical protein Bbelb_276800 [Branchiostoma belcheri]
MVADAAAITDNPRRDEGIDADWKAITTVVVVAIVADAALIMSARCDGAEHCDNYGDSGGNISYGDGDGRGGMVLDATRATMPTIRAAKKVLQATAVVAPTAMIQDAMGAAMSPRRRYRSGGAEDCGDYGESFYSDRGVRGGSDYPGLDEGGKVSLEAMTAVVAEAMVPKTKGNGSDSAGDVSKATTVVAAVVITKDATRASMPNRR